MAERKIGRGTISRGGPVVQACGAADGNAAAAASPIAPKNHAQHLSVKSALSAPIAIDKSIA